jgi:hypothetical protein
METQQFWSESSSDKGQPKMSLVAFVFFLMGAWHIYAHLQRQKHSFNSRVSSLLKVSLLAALVAGLLEILILESGQVVG